MDHKELITYVNECRRQGMNDIQIANTLGMDVKTLLDILNPIEKKPAAKKAQAAKKVEPRPIESPAVESINPEI